MILGFNHSPYDDRDRPSGKYPVSFSYAVYSVIGVWLDKSYRSAR